MQLRSLSSASAPSDADWLRTQSARHVKDIHLGIWLKSEQGTQAIRKPNRALEDVPEGRSRNQITLQEANRNEDRITRIRDAPRHFEQIHGFEERATPRYIGVGLTI